MSLVELIGQADERGLAASGLACLDRCIPLLGGDDEVLRPLWAGLADDAGAAGWGERLEQVRGKLGGEFGAGDFSGTGTGTGEDEAVLLARRMLAAAPVERSAAGIRAWADACSVAALRIHRLLDPLKDAGDSVDARREGRTEGMSPSSPPNFAARSPSWNFSPATARQACARPWRCRRRAAGCCARWCPGGADGEGERGSVDEPLDHRVPVPRRLVVERRQIPVRRREHPRASRSVAVPPCLGSNSSRTTSHRASKSAEPRYAETRFARAAVRSRNGGLSWSPG